MTRHEIEKQQIKLVYAAVYIGLGVMDEAAIPEIERQAANAPAQPSETFLAGPLAKLVQMFRKSLGDLQGPRALEHWRWMIRSSSDDMVRRYLAQNSTLSAALINIADGIKWVARNDPSRELYRGELFYIGDKSYIKQYEKEKAMIIGRDRLSRPLICIRCAQHLPKAQTKVECERLAIAIMETSYLFQSPNTDGTTIIWDMSDWGLQNVDYHLVYYLIQAQKCYPDLVGTMFIYKAPRLFEAFWKVIKVWLPPQISEKIVFAYKRNDLLSLVGIDNLPTSLGGMARDLGGWKPPSPHDDPSLADVNARIKLEMERQQLLAQFEISTRDWVLDQQHETQQREHLAELCSENFWQLDPYVRRSTIWDRQGVLRAA